VIKMQEEEKEFEKDIIERVNAIANRIANCIDSKYPCRPTPKWSYDLYELVDELAKHYDFERIYTKESRRDWIRKDKEEENARRRI